MKILFFDDFRLGVLKGDAVVDVSKVVKGIPHTGPHDLISGLVERFADYRRKLEKAVAAGRGIPLKKVRIRPPLPKPSIADATEIGGVIIPSARSAVAPRIVGMTKYFP